MPDVVITRVPHSGTRRSRNLEERLMVRFPGVYRALSALAVRRLPRRARVRRALGSRAIASGWAAASRRDFELMLVRYSPDLEIEFDADFEALGLGGTRRGHQGMVELINAFGEAWERWELRPVAVIDLGNRALALGIFHLPGNVSGLELEPEFASLLTVRGGVVARQQDFLSWEKGLRAAGLDADAIGLPARARAGRV
jgi:ketosteroid isomerase-like protein